MAFQCTFADTPFTLDSPEIVVWASQSINPLDMREIMSIGSGWNPPKNLSELGPQLFPDPPALRIGQFFYPTGATRWAEFRGLASETQFKAMRDACWTANGVITPQAFVMRADADVPNDTLSSGGITTPMILLSARPLTSHASSAFENLFLITLVDERYYWQFNSPGDFMLDGASTWAGVLNGLAIAADIDLTYDTIEDVYGRPSPDSPLFCHYETTARLLDAAAWNTGRVLVRNLDGTFKLERPEDSTFPQATSNLAGGAPTTITSRWYEGVFPQSVMVTFPKFVSGKSYVDARDSRTFAKPSYGNVRAIEITATAAGFADKLGGDPYSKKVIRDTARAYYVDLATAQADTDTTTGSSTAGNASELDDLALQIAKDYYNSLLTGLDETYHGIYAWQPESVHDVIWTYRLRESWTRVQRKPWNFGPEEMQHEVQGDTAAGQPGTDPTPGGGIGGGGIITGSGGQDWNAFKHAGSTWNRWYASPMATAQAPSQVSLGPDTLYLMPFISARSGQIDNMRVNIALMKNLQFTLKFCIYTAPSNSDLLPQSLYFESIPQTIGSPSGTTLPGFCYAVGIVDTELNPATLYWLGVYSYNRVSTDFPNSGAFIYSNALGLILPLLGDGVADVNNPGIAITKNLGGVSTLPNPLPTDFTIVKAFGGGGSLNYGPMITVRYAN